jgi:hypothetical protein
VIARIELSSDSLNLGAALALTNPQITLLTLFHRGSGPAEAAVPPAWLVDVPTEMEAVFPSEPSDRTLERESDRSHARCARPGRSGERSPVAVRTDPLRATSSEGHMT